MRILAATTVAVSLASLTACLGNPGEPLGSTGDRDGRVNEARVNAGFAAPELNLLTARNIERTPGSPSEEAPPPPADDFQQQAIADVAASIDYASLQAFAVADAGIARDRASAELAAIELANAAVLVQQRANEMRALSSTSGGTEECGCGGCTTEPTDPGTGELPAPVEDAVTLAILGAEAGAEVAGQLNPPSTTVCTEGGCHATCTEVPGEIDETGLDGAIDDAEAVGNEAAELGAELGGLGVFG